MSKLKVAVLPGDGIGPEVILAALPVFAALNIPVEIKFGDIGWEFWKQKGNPIPDQTWELIKESDTTLLGAITSKPEKEAMEELHSSLQEKQIKYVSPILQLRQNLDLYANVRPCFNIKESNKIFNFCIVRENTEGLYAGFDFFPIPNPIKQIIDSKLNWKNIRNDEVGCTFRLQSKQGLTRLFEYAFKLAYEKNYPRVTFVDKPNVLRQSSAFARTLFENVAENYPNIKADILNVDAVALWLIRRPEEFGVIVAENMFGDILSDLGAGVMGGLGFASSANIGEKDCYFEPVHGSAPRIKPNTANPSAMFLTIALLLENFGYLNEALRIKQAISNTIHEGRYLTYDLEGNASTTDMANAIIEQSISPKKRLRVSFLATGSEIIQGDLQESNCYQFAKAITKNGGLVYQHVQVSDKKKDITNAACYLLDYSDAVILTGGLGPTSDDNTRFALAEVSKSELIFNETAWKHVTDRLQRFNLKVTESNRRQALFPRNAELFSNEHGTAYGAYLKYHEKHLFMLPGPPKESIPMFEKYVIHKLAGLNFFSEKQTLKWLTLGLIEGEIAEQIEEVIKDTNIEAAYRWSYPYLEIKIISQDNELEKNITDKIENLLQNFIVSTNGNTAMEQLVNSLKNFSEIIYFVNEDYNIMFPNVNSQKLLLIDKSDIKTFDGIIVIFKMAPTYLESKEFNGSIMLDFKVLVNNQIYYTNNFCIPNRGPEIINYFTAYIAWQITEFIHFRKSKNEKTSRSII